VARVFANERITWLSNGFGFTRIIDAKAFSQKLGQCGKKCMGILPWKGRYLTA
jgi:hypothetical protein